MQQRRKAAGQIYLLQGQASVSIFLSPPRHGVGLARTGGILGTLHGPPWHGRASFKALPAEGVEN